MKRLFTVCVLALPIVVLCTVPLAADVKTRERTQVKLEGLLGRMAGMFGGKAARDGIVTTSAVRGDRKAEMSDTTGRIVDLTEEKVYDLDLRRRTYQVTTFEELRRRMREAQEKAAREREKAKDAPGEQPDSAAAELEFDFDVEESGQKKQLAGYDAREVVLTVTMRQKGRALEDGGGFVMTSNTWLGPEIPAMKELGDFELRYWKAIAPEAAGMSPEQMAAVMAMYPMFGKAMERIRAESHKLEGTPLATTMVFEAVRSKEQLAEQKQSRSGGGLGGMLAGRLMKREEQPRATVFTSTHEVLEVTPSVADADLALPAGFKERK